MSMRDKISYYTPLGVTTTDVVDRQGYNALSFLVSLTGAGSGELNLNHGDLADGSDMAPVPGHSLLGTPASVSMDGAGVGDMRKVGYVGDKRYVKLVSTGGNMMVVALLDEPALGPTANPPLKYVAPVMLEAAQAEAPAEPAPEPAPPAEPAPEPAPPAEPAPEPAPPAEPAPA